MIDAKIIAFRKLLEILKELFNDEKIDLERLFVILSLIGDILVKDEIKNK